MDFIRYADASAGLLNAELADVVDLVRLLADRESLHEQATDRDCLLLRRFQRALRPVFAGSEASAAADVIAGLNELMARYPITPQISDHDPAALHLHVATRSSVADLLIGESLLGLASVVCELGPTRLGVCSAIPCTNAYVDTSPNQSRRYCSDRCSSRANVAAYRARRRQIGASGGARAGAPA